jgi:hypothetical protein
MYQRSDGCGSPFVQCFRATPGSFASMSRGQVKATYAGGEVKTGRYMRTEYTGGYDEDGSPRIGVWASTTTTFGWQPGGMSRLASAPQGASVAVRESKIGADPPAGTVTIEEGIPIAYTDESGETKPLVCAGDRCWPSQVTLSTDEIIKAFCGGDPFCIMAQSADWAGAEKRIHDFAISQVTNFALGLAGGALGAVVAKVAGPMRLEFQIFRGSELIKKGVMWSGRGGHAEMKFLAKYGHLLMEGDQVVLQGGYAICRYGACRSALNEAAKTAGANVLYYGYTPHMSLTYFEGGVGWIKAP